MPSAVTAMQMVGLGCVGILAVMGSHLLYPNPPGASGLLLAVLFIAVATAGAEVIHRAAVKAAILNHKGIRWFDG